MKQDFPYVLYHVNSLSPLLELFATEHAHVRMLIVLQTVFSRPMEREDLFSAQEIAAIFPSLDEIIEMHSECCYKEAISDLRLYPHKVPTYGIEN